jgi:hypothetical protein
VNGGPLVLLDVDGVLNLARFRSSKQRSDLLRSREGWFHRRPRDAYSDDRLLVNLKQVRPLVRELAAAAGNAGGELAWATTWGPAANDYFVPLLGLEKVLPVAPVNFRLSTKAATVIPWAEGRPWAWLEDLPQELELARALTSRAVPCCPVLVDRATGLAGGHVSVVTNWLKTL